MVETRTAESLGKGAGHSGDASGLERLRATVDGFGTAPFAVLDGAQFDDLPSLLRERRAFARSLFLDHADAEVEQAGPWLVPLADREDLTEAIFDLVGARAAAVFWSCPGGEAVLYRHLRSLNLVRIPATWMDGPVEVPEGGSAETIWPAESVMFRHWDPRVLAALLPVLEAAQFSRMLGPATEIALHAGDYGGLKRVVHDERWPPMPAGMLTFRPDQMEALAGRTVAASHRRIAAYLRSYAPARTAHLNEAELLSAVRDYEREAKQLGIRNEDAIGMWAYMSTATAKPLYQDGRVRQRLVDRSSTSSPDERVYALFGEWTRVDVRGFTG